MSDETTRPTDLDKAIALAEEHNQCGRYEASHYCPNCDNNPVSDLIKALHTLRESARLTPAGSLWEAERILRRALTNTVTVGYVDGERVETCESCDADHDGESQCGYAVIQRALDALPPRPPDAPAQTPQVGHFTLPLALDEDPRADGADQIVDAKGLTVCFMSTSSSDEARDYENPIGKLIVKLVNESAQPASGETPPPWTRAQVLDRAEHLIHLAESDEDFQDVEMLRYLAQTCPDAPRPMRRSQSCECPAKPGEDCPLDADQCQARVEKRVPIAGPEHVRKPEYPACHYCGTTDIHNHKPDCQILKFRPA